MASRGMMQGMPTLEVKLFAVLRDRFAADSVPVEITAGMTASDLMARLRETHPAHARHLAVCRLAVNRKFASGPEKVAPTDEVALIPPVSGG